MKKILLIIFLLPFIGFGQTVVDLASWALTKDGNGTNIQTFVQSGNFTAPNTITYNTSGARVGGWGPEGSFVDYRYFEISIAPTTNNVIWISNLLFQQERVSNSGNNGPSNYRIKYFISSNGSTPSDYDFYNQSTTLISDEVIASNPSKNVQINQSLNPNQKLIIRFYARGGNSWNGDIGWRILANTLKFTGYKLPPLNGTYIIGSVAGAHFPTITAAVSRLNNVGADGDVTFLLDNILYTSSTNEIFPIVINPYTGNNLYKVTFKPNAGKTVTVSASNTSNTVSSVFKLNGVDRVVFDGSNTENGATKDLTLYNTTTSTNSSNSRAVIWIASENSTNGSTDNEIKNIILKQHNKGGASDYSIGIFAGGTSSITSAAEAANSYTTVTNVEFNKVGQAIYVNGNSNTGLLSSNWYIKGNTIGNTSTDNTAKPYVAVNFMNVKYYEVSNNIIDGLINDINSNVSSTHAAIWIDGVSNGTIYNNKIANLSNSLGNGTPQSRGIYINSSNNTIYNNFISNVYSSVNAGGNGIYINSGIANKIYYNTIAMNNNNNPTGSSCLYINGGSTLDIKNNIFYNSQTTGSQYAVYSNVAKSAFTEIDYNDYYAPVIGYIESIVRTTLPNWRTGTGKDFNSINILPTFVSATDLHLSNGENSKLKAAKPIDGITIDIDGDMRATVPYIGADEILCSFLVTWNGSWSSKPTIDSKVVFVKNYNSDNDVDAKTKGLVEACSCYVKDNAEVIFNEKHTLKVANEVKVESGLLTFKNNASLVQVNDAAVNTGNVIYKRETGILNRYDFTYWSSPVGNMTLGLPSIGLSPTTFFDKYFSYINVNVWALESRATVMKKGVGYSVRAPQSYKTTGSTEKFTASFTGVPNNGVVTLSGLAANKAHLLGNPYPSAIDADAFLKLNSDINVSKENRVLEGTLYFWTHNTPPSDIPGDKKYNYTTADYATYNRTGGVGTAPVPVITTIGGATSSSGTILTGKIAAGQGFFAPTKAGGNVVFNNSMRVVGGTDGKNNSQFFKLSTGKMATTTAVAAEKSRIWLNLTNSEGAFKQTLVGYITGATNDYEGAFDGVTYDGNAFVDFYSVNNEVNLAIQGRALPFVKKDSVALGYKSTIVGDFQISIDETDGVLSNENVFLEDKELKVLHNLKKEAYTFSTQKGTFNNRFVLRYVDKNAIDLVPEIPADSNTAVTVSVKNGKINVNSPVELIDRVIVYDVAGRKLYLKNKVTDKNLIVENILSSHQVLVVKITLENGKIVASKIIY